MKARILWVEGKGKRADSPAFVTDLRKKSYIVETVFSGAEALLSLSNFDPDLVVVNTASMRSSGKRICMAVREAARSVPLLVISGPDRSNPEEVDANVHLLLPFTIRKLLNRIVPLLPGDGGKIMHVGPVRLDLELKRVRCQGRDTTLTPRLCQLLKTLMEHPGEALNREDLFRQVWETEYTGDTRTLDVHISWLRKAIEANPRKPVFLKTIRGIGYRLEA